METPEYDSTHISQLKIMSDDGLKCRKVCRSNPHLPSPPLTLPNHALFVMMRLLLKFRHGLRASSGRNAAPAVVAATARLSVITR